MTTIEQPKKISYAFTPAEHHLLPDGLAYVPKPIAAANKRARTALETYLQAHAAVRAAEEAVAAAETFDMHAREAAITAGEDSPTPTAPLRTAEAREAEAQAVAAETVARREIVALYEVIRQNLDDYIEGRRRAVAEAEALPLELVANLREAWPQIREQREQLRMAEEFWPQPAAMPLVHTYSRPRLDRAAEQVRQILQMRRTDPRIPCDMPHVVAALSILLEAEAQPTTQQAEAA